MRKTEKVNKALKHIDNLDMSSLEIERIISELESMFVQKEKEELNNINKLKIT